MKKIISLLLSVLLAASVFTALPLSAGAAENRVGFRRSKVAEGTTGDCAWELDSWGTLTVSGSGRHSGLHLERSAVGGIRGRYPKH